VLLLAVFAAVVAAGTLASAQGPAPVKRPLTHADYDGWRTVQMPTLSRDGRYLAYNLMPSDADGEFVVRNLASGGEHRVPRGKSGLGAGGPGAPGEAKAAAPMGESADEDEDQQKGFGKGAGKGFGKGAAKGLANRPGMPLAAAAPQFTPDSKAIVFALIPTKAEIDKARQQKEPAAAPPAPSIAIMDLASGKITTKIERASSYAVVGSGAGLLVYRRTVKSDMSPPATDTKSEPKETGKGEKGTAKLPRTFGTDLVLRNLADGSERVVEEVAEHSITRDGKLLVCVVSSKKEENCGVFAITDLPHGPAIPLISGKGKYSRLIWDEQETQLVFFSDRDDAKAEKPQSKLYHWNRQTMAPSVAQQAGAAKGGPRAEAEEAKARPAPATDLLPMTPTGIRTGWSISERGAVTFSADGSRLYVATAEVRKDDVKSATTTSGEAPMAKAAPADDKAVFELWHYKDELIQPMQKVRGAADGNRTHRAVFFIKDRLFRHLSDKDVDVAPFTAGDWALSTDSKPYKKLTGYGPSLADYALVNVRTGENRPLVQAWQWPPNAAHDGKHMVSYDGKDWNAIATDTGKRVNLTHNLPVKFVNESHDQPSEAPAYGIAGWTTDARHVLLHDRYDIWKVAVDGSGATMLTAGIGRKTRTQLRIIRTDGPGAPLAALPGTPPPAAIPGTPPGQPASSDTPQRGIDLSKPLLLKAVNEYTRDEGFYRLEPGAAEPRLLVMGARAYGNPIKAKDAETYLLTISTFSDYPDYFVTGPDFREFRRVTDANPKTREFVWGKAELVRYKNTDGVELAGMLIKPENFDAHKKYPMLVYIYERLSQNLHRFVMPNVGTSINPTYYASNGYLVFQPDIAYTVGAPGQSAMKCVLPGIQAVVDRGCVDEQAIGIQGHSWGGYQIAYMVTQTTRFKAAAAGAPVSNMVSAYDGIRWGTGLPRQFQYERTQSRIGATLWQAPQKFIENSPIFMADRVQTPLLMLHNDQDDAVPWYQGIEYYLALRRLGKECYLFNYNGEPHGLKKKANQRDYTMRMQQFFDHHLKGAPMPEWMAKGIPARPREGVATPPGPAQISSEVP
jgi:dipeptidyl aminopeptidase/acylaminoacyl peptidase